jgi:AcrR family transcriptional regulator
MPRPYRLGLRQAAADETRTRVLAAARALLAAGAGPGGFSVDAVAKAADVARMTVYYQFGSKAGLLQALFDDLAARGGLRRLAGAFQQAEPLDALAEFVRVFCGFWASDRVIFRNLRALAALDPELDQALAAREAGARQGLRVLLNRLAEATGRPAPDEIERTAAVLFTLTSFQTFDSLSTQLEAGTEEVATLIHALALCTLKSGPR